MIKVFSRIRRGLGDLPHCGPHPGTEIFFALVLISSIAGGWVGFLVSTVLYGSIYLWGAYERAKDDEYFERLDNGNN